MNAMRPTVPLLLLAAAVGAMIAGCEAGSGTANDFRLETLNHGRFYLNRHRGRPVVLVFWTTWCITCKQELTYLNDLRREFAEDELTLASVCVDPENIDLARRITEDLALGYPVLLDEMMKDGSTRVAGTFGVRSFPTTVILDAGGKIAWSCEGFGPTDKSAIGRQIDRLLAAKATRP